MRSAVDLAVRPDLAVRVVTCDDDHTGWSAPEPRTGYGIVLVRRGRFRRSVSGVAADHDPTLAYLATPGTEERFAHPVGGDVCTWVSLSNQRWHELARDDQRLSRSTIYVDARLDLAHRRLLAAARSRDVDYAVPEELLALLGLAIGQVGTRTAPAEGSRGLVGAARAAIVDGHPASAELTSLAGLLGVSPYRLSRAFTGELGVSLTRYRNRIRVGRALDRIEQGADSLAVLAADLGFADQAHLCRTVRAHLGHTPTALRRLLS
jgi:AraC-like DNA-binding protein